MSSAPSVAADCKVTAGWKLPAEMTAEAICATIRDALAAGRAKSGVMVEILVTSQSSLTARIEVGGKRLPDEELAVMDRTLSKSSVEMLARRIAEVASKAAGQG